MALKFSDEDIYIGDVLDCYLKIPNDVNFSLPSSQSRGNIHSHLILSNLNLLFEIFVTEKIAFIVGAA